MIDDQFDARPQSGFNAASVVWQAPAEGGIPRYMLIFQDQVPAAVGPVRSSRYYYIAWAAEWRRVYAHVGGSPQAIATLTQNGKGQLVYNADQFRWGDVYFRRISDAVRAAQPLHRRQAAVEDGRPCRREEHADPAGLGFRPGCAARRAAGRRTISVTYDANKISYAYDRATQHLPPFRHRREGAEGRGDGQRVAPKNVVIMRMSFGPLNDGHPGKLRLEANVIGSGKAWIATNGKTIAGTWKKTALTAPTQFFDAQANPVTLTVGQTFIQVMKQNSPVSIKDGALPGSGPSASASSSAATR